MSSEKQITALWARLFRGQPVTTETVTEAQGLLAELRPHSPLLFRLERELEEIRALHKV